MKKNVFPMKRTLLLVGFLLWLGVGSVSGQAVGGYFFETGYDSTMWVDMTDAQLYPDGDLQMVEMGFSFFFCGTYYRQLSFGKRGNIIYFDYPEVLPTQVFRDVAQPLMAPYCTGVYANEVLYKLTGVAGRRILVVEFRIVVEDAAIRPLQVHISERDGSFTYLYGEKGYSAQRDRFYVGFKGEEGTIVNVSQSSEAVPRATLWGVYDWPGDYRYYRFTPDMEVGRCGFPRGGVTVLSVTDEEATLCWHRAFNEIGYEITYCIADSSYSCPTIFTPDTCITLTGLLPMTAYQVQVQSICGRDSSRNIVEGRFRTACHEERDNLINFADLYGDHVVCRTGWYQAPSTTTGVVDFGPTSRSSRHTVHTNINETDSRTHNMLHTVPDGHCQSVRLGNWATGRQEESITYTIKVDSNLFDLLILRYAIVEQNPDHPEEEQPKFLLSFRDSAGRLIDNCYYANFVAGLGSSVWQQGVSGVVWRDWTAVGIDLTPLHGRTINVVLDNFDCDLGGHYGYAYFTLESAFKRLQSARCGYSWTNTFYAPKGFSYRWYRRDNPGVTLGRADSLTVTGQGEYKCRVSFLTGDSSCGFTLTCHSGPRFPVAAFTAVPIDSCGYSYRFENNSVVAHDVDHTQLTSDHCEQYLWRFGDGTESTAVNPVHTFESGVFDVELVAMLSNGHCRDSVRHTIVVNRLRDTIADTFCVGGAYSFYGNYFNQPGMYTLTDGCRQHTVRLSQKQYFYEELMDTVCQGDIYRLGEYSFVDEGVYDVNLVSVEGCDSSYLFTLATRPLPEGEYDISHICRGDVYYYMTGRYSAADSSSAESGSVCFVGEDGLLYCWKALSPSAALPWLTADGQVQIAPKRTSTYYVTYQYMDSPSCPVGDTVVLAPLEEIVADFEVSPTWLGYDKMDLTVLDRSRNAEGRIWFIDRVEQDDSGSVLYYSISEDADSVVVGIVAFNNTCSDTAERVVPVLHHMLTFPNVFTPSLNDNNRFGPIGHNVTDYELWIYDRRGNLVFHCTDVTEMWDGTCNGAPCRQESYTYTCRYTTPTNDRLSMTGTVTLLR